MSFNVPSDVLVLHSDLECSRAGHVCPEYIFSFQHYTRVRMRWSKGVQIKFDQRCTKCTVSVAPNGMARRHILVRAVVGLNFNDTFCRSEGRKYALTKALQQLGWIRLERGKVWEAYWQSADGDLPAKKKKAPLELDSAIREAAVKSFTDSLSAGTSRSPTVSAVEPQKGS
jgi:hypothetical protein